MNGAERERERPERDFTLRRPCACSAVGVQTRSEFDRVAHARSTTLHIWKRKVTKQLRIPYVYAGLKCFQFCLGIFMFHAVPP